MAIITQRGTVDLIPEYNRALRPIFCVSEGDANSRVINLSVTSGGEAFPIPSGAMVYIAGKKQDNNIFTYGCSFTSNTVVFPITAQMSALDGIVLCELQIIENGNPLGTANFVYWVEPSPIQNGTTSESDLNLFEEAISKFENFDHFYADVEAMVTEAVANMQIREGQTVIDASLTVEGAAADAKATGDVVRAFMNALVSETTEEATIATCDDAAGGLPLKKLTANIVPAQAGSGDPSPDNVRAISGYSAVNVYRAGAGLLDGVTYRSGYYDNSGAFVSSVNTKCTNEYIPCTGGTVYAIRFVYGNTNTSSRVRVHEYDAGQNWLRQVASVQTTNSENAITITWTATNDAKYFRFSLPLFAEIECVGDADTYAVNFSSEAGTVYGGTLIVNSDGSGALTLNYGVKTYDGSESWVTYSTHGYHVTNSEMMRGTWWDDAHTLCNEFTKVADNSVLGIRPGVNNQEIYVVAVNGNLADVTSLATWKTWLASNPLTVTYPLATPTTYALSAAEVATMLNGVNNIWTDAAGTLTAEYYASTGLYVEKKVNAQRNMIAGVEEDMIATKNYSVNDLLIVGNTLYKATAAISSGAALVVGTNVTETTVAEQLLALA